MIFYLNYNFVFVLILDDKVKVAMLVAEIISCLKRSLARMLVIVVSLGFGIVK